MSKILIIDDEQDFVTVLSGRLKANNYQVITAHDGLEGLTYATTEHPDLIILDILMPGMSGFEVLKNLKRDPKTRRIPVLMLSAKGDTDSLFRAEEFEATDYLIKPFDTQEFMAMVKKYIE
ncbi:MAG: response regulator [Candidatus Omnitrophota bacterium]